MFLLRYQTLPFFFSSQFVLVNSLEVCEAISLKNERRKPRREKRRKKNLTQSTPSTLVCNSGNSTVLGFRCLKMLLLLTVTRYELLVYLRSHDTSCWFNVLKTECKRRFLESSLKTICFGRFTLLQVRLHKLF